jgi:hypothetical protein
MRISMRDFIHAALAAGHEPQWIADWLREVADYEAARSLAATAPDIRRG